MINPPAYLFRLLLFVLLIQFGPAAFARQDQALPADSSQSIPDTLLFKIQKAQSAITEINAANKKGYNAEAQNRILSGIKGNLEPIEQAFKNRSSQFESKALISYNLILKDAQEQLNNLRTVLSKQNNELQRMSDEVVSLSNDSLLTVSQGDDVEKKLYAGQLIEIKQRLQNAGKITGLNLSQVSKMLADVSAMSLSVTDLQNLINDQLQQSGRLAFSKESPYLWNAPIVDKNTAELIKTSYLGQHQILSYFFGSTWDNRILTLIFGLAFFFWVYSNYKNAARPLIVQKIGALNFEYLKPYPILATVIVLLNITPLFEPDAPSLYIEIVQLLLLLAISAHLFKVLPPKQLKYWILIIVLYAIIMLNNPVASSALWVRLVLIAINVAFIYIAYLLYKNLRLKQFPKKYVKIVLFILLSFNVLAVLLNIFGRITLSKLLSITAVIGFTQMIGLAVFMQIVLDAIELQIKISACNKGLFSRISHTRARVSFKRILSMVAVVIWLMVFLINLGLISGTIAFLEGALTKARNFGSIHFTLGNVLYFVIIVYVANKLQKYVPVLFGEQNVDFGEGAAHKSSKVALVRLIIIVIGVLLAVTASGLPMDKLTVLLGALGVGVGLGMQNIVNNFVSGIILIFEKPFRIGDYVELADKKGKVRDIGIRSSKLLTPQGSEVIIPNGDLLSGRLVNWTLSNDFLKTELTFKINAAAEPEAIKKIIQEEVLGMEHLMQNTQPEILINTIAADSIEFKVLVWITSIYTEAGFKSDLYGKLLSRFKDAEIKVM